MEQKLPRKAFLQGKKIITKESTTATNQREAAKKALATSTAVETPMLTRQPASMPAAAATQATPVALTREENRIANLGSMADRHWNAMTSIACRSVSDADSDSSSCIASAAPTALVASAHLAKHQLPKRASVMQILTVQVLLLQFAEHGVLMTQVLFASWCCKALFRAGC